MRVFGIPLGVLTAYQTPAGLTYLAAVRAVDAPATGAFPRMLLTQRYAATAAVVSHVIRLVRTVD